MFGMLLVVSFKAISFSTPSCLRTRLGSQGEEARILQHPKFDALLSRCIDLVDADHHTFFEDEVPRSQICPTCCARLGIMLLSM
jgi:hypothetical protein